MKKTSLFNFAIFLSAFLFFQIELIIAKIILPKFGGSYMVWGACVVFFQGILLLGYLYSHLVVQKIGAWRYRKYHLILLLLPLLFFPGRNIPDITADYNIPPAIDVSWKLLCSVGLVFFALSTTGIIFQSWLAESDLAERKNPYILYSLSNLGSFAALLSYPFLFEPALDLDWQVFIWRAGYFFLLLLHFAVFFLVKANKSVPEKTAPVFSDIQAGRETWRWVLLGAGPAIMFLSVTNIITSEVAPIPLLWIIPLCIYLASFVLNFRQKPWCPAWIREKIFIAVGLSALLFFFVQRGVFPFTVNLGLLLFSLFVICMFCQNELYLTRPKDQRKLTLFYFLIASGSFAGGIAVNWIIPLVATFMIEYLFGLLTVSLAVAAAEKNKEIGAASLRFVLYSLIVLSLWPLIFKGYNVFGVAVIIWIFVKVFSRLKLRPRAFAIGITCIFLVSPFVERLYRGADCIYTLRNYYGILNVYANNKLASLYHGTTLHGMQYFDNDPKKENEPLGYFHRITPIGELMSSDKFDFRRIGIVGLGCGTLSAYGRPGQEIDFFEIDRDVYYIASELFTYLGHSGAKLNFVFGDARVSIAGIKDRKYDLLVIDAFSGDSIPVHLLTTEAIREYQKHLSGSGIIMFHISNRYLNLAPVMLNNAFSVNAQLCSKANNSSRKDHAEASQWIAYTWDKAVFQKLVSQLNWDKPNPKIKSKRPWTDKYSGISGILKLKNIVSGIKYFTPFYF